MVSATAARLALTLAARAGVPAARPEGLGAAVAGVVPIAAALGAAAAVTLAAAGAGTLLGPNDVVRTALAVLCAVAAAELLLRHCVRRFGGVTGDVFGGARGDGGHHGPGGLGPRLIREQEPSGHRPQHASRSTPSSYFFSIELSRILRDSAQNRSVGSSYSTWKTALPASMNGCSRRTRRTARTAR